MDKERKKERRRVRSREEHIHTISQPNTGSDTDKV